MATTAFSGYVYTAYGDSLQELRLRNDLQLSSLAPSQVRVKVISAGANPVDWKIVETGAFWMPTTPSPETPRRIGFDMSGQVIEVGADVKGLSVGDHVYGMADLFQAGTMAEYIDVDEKFVALKPSQLSFNEASVVPAAALTCYQALTTYANVQAGQRVLILGGSGGTGVMAVQLAKILGAHVIATTSSRNVEFVQSLGADEVIDYTQNKWVEVLAKHSIDVIYDCGVEPDAWFDDAQTILKQNSGQFVTIGRLSRDPIDSPIGATVNAIHVESSAQTLEVISKLIQEGKLAVHITSVFQLADYLDALKLIKTGHVRGKVAIEVQTLD